LKAKHKENHIGSKRRMTKTLQGNHRTFTLAYSSFHADQHRSGRTPDQHRSGRTRCRWVSSVIIL